MRHDDVSSEITGRATGFPNVPAQMKKVSASSVRYEIKMSRQEIPLYSVIWGNLSDERTGVSRGHSSPMPGVMSRTW
jgi:hypothetical protein